MVLIPEIGRTFQVLIKLLQTVGPVPRDVSLPAVVTNDEKTMKAELAANELCKRPCSIFFKCAHKTLNMSILFQDLSKLSIVPSALRGLQAVSKDSYVITFRDPEQRRAFTDRSFFISRPE